MGLILIRGKWEPCPIHGKKSDILLDDGRLPNGESLYDLLHIPVEYRGHWVTDISRLFLNEDITKNCVKDSVAQLKYMLETLYNVIAIEDNIYMNSLFFYSNQNLLDLKPYMYTLQRIAFEKNMSVLPAISMVDLAGLLAFQEFSSISVRDESDVEYITKLNRLAGQGADWYLRTGLTYTDYLRCSLCFVIDNRATMDTHLNIFSGFLEERSRRGLPTYVFSTNVFDQKRENLFYDKSHNRVLSSLTPYLLLAKSQEPYARERGWLRNVNEAGSQSSSSLVHGFTLADFAPKKEANIFDLD
jgi:hypothetical protein